MKTYKDINKKGSLKCCSKRKCVTSNILTLEDEYGRNVEKGTVNEDAFFNIDLKFDVLRFLHKINKQCCYFHFKK